MNDVEWVEIPNDDFLDNYRVVIKPNNEPPNSYNIYSIPMRQLVKLIQNALKERSENDEK